MIWISEKLFEVTLEVSGRSILWFKLRKYSSKLLQNNNSVNLISLDLKKPKAADKMVQGHYQLHIKLN